MNKSSLILTILILTVFHLIHCAKLPSILIKCNYDDTKCTRDAAKHALEVLKDGYPELGIPPLDPFVIPSVTIGAGQKVDVVQNYKNFTLLGFSQPSSVEKFDIDGKNKKLSVYIKYPSITFKALYTIKGKILLLEVYGSGPNTIKLDDFTLKIDVDVDSFKKSNDLYLKVTKYKFIIAANHITYDYANLFDGNEQLGTAINNVLNDNWNEVFIDIKSNYENEIGKQVIKIMNDLFSKIPLKELFSNYEALLKEAGAS